jgi:hypothetical protein
MEGPRMRVLLRLLLDCCEMEIQSLDLIVWFAKIAIRFPAQQHRTPHYEVREE